jgi:acetoin utilization protein AcuB
MPHTLGEDIPLKVAMNLMRDQRIRHLPIQTAGKLVGILTDRDVKLASSLVTSATELEKLVAGDIMTPDPYTVAPETPLNDVVLKMAEHKYGCAIIQQGNGKVVGIFTATDALRVLGEQLEQHYRAGGF